jgi:hypothetical protein
MSLKIMLHGRLREGVAEAAGSAPCSGTAPKRSRRSGFERSAVPAAVAAWNGSIASSSTVSQQVRRASFGQLGYDGVGVLRLPAPVHRRRGDMARARREPGGAPGVRSPARAPPKGRASRRAALRFMSLARRLVCGQFISARPPNPREWLPGPWAGAADRVRWPGRAAMNAAARLPTRTGQGRAVGRDLRRPISTFDDVGFQARGESGPMSRGTTR